MIIDAHLHLWRADPDYPNQQATAMSPASDVPLQLLEQYMAEFSVDRAVIVQPIYPGEDNSYVADTAAANPDKYTAVCVVDPRHADAATRLQHWVEQRGCRGLRLRPVVPEEAECFGTSSTFPLWEYAEQARVVVSVLCEFAHLDTLFQLAKRFSTTTLVVDHLAHPPDPRPAACDPLLRLSDYPNVVLKVSGFSSFSHEPYPYGDCDALVRAVYDQFGAQRMIWGSDFPHVLLQSGYARSLRWLERSCDFLTASEVAAILAGNAARLYWDQSLPQ